MNTISLKLNTWVYDELIEYLLYINGINSAYSNYDFDDKDEVEIYITYDSSIISKEDLDKLSEEFNS